MRFSKTFRNLCALTMALLLTHLPNVAFAESKMISTSEVAERLSRGEAEAKVEGYLQRQEIRQGLLDRGISPDEVSHRLASLSDTELSQMATEMDRAQYGGNILLTVLLVVLIIYLVKRI
ncbi:MAG: PA2779 family protein [Pseudobdellovibrionaceae bacterium]